MKVFLLFFTNFWIVLFTVELLLVFVFFNYSPLPGYLFSNVFKTTTWNFLVRLIFTFGFVAPITLRSYSNAFAMGVYHFFLGLYCFMNYLNNLLLEMAVPYECKTLHISCRKYIQIKILVTQFNDLFRKRIFIETLLPSFLIPFFSLYVVCKFHNYFSLIPIVFLLALVIVLYPGLETVLVMAAATWIKSSHVKTTLSAKILMTGNMVYEKRLLKSLAMLKIRFGENNFVEAATPLVFVSYNLSQLSSLLCMKV